MYACNLSNRPKKSVMVREKRDAATLSKQSQLPSPAPPDPTSATGPSPAAGGVSNVDHPPKPAMETPAETNSNADTSSSYDSIKNEFIRAMGALFSGNYLKALRLMNDLCSKHENPADSALVHRLQGTICGSVASFTDNANAKQRQWRNSIESAKKAASLSPRSIEYPHFYATLLYKAANKREEYEEVVLECERALAIENPVDPAKERLLDEDQQEISTAEARVALVQSELRSLIQKSNAACISHLVQNICDAVEKFSAVDQDSRPNETAEVAKLIEARLEDLAEKDAIEKSNAASESFLAELARDSKKSGAGLDSPKRMHVRTNDETKSKEKRKNKNPKATHNVELQDQKAEEIAHESEGQDYKIADPRDVDAWRLQEEEYKLRIESEAVERKLEEALEYQRQMEDEAKRKHLAEQQKRIPETSSENAGTIMKDPLEDVHKNTADGATLRTVMKDADGTDTYGTGLKNEFGELNCFLNAVIQSLWHLRWFRYNFMLRTASQHVHVGDPCVLCALYDIFIALRMASKDIKREAVARTSLRVALSNLYPNSNFFQEGQMNDASELLNALLGCFHESFTLAESSPCLGACIAHLIFGLEQLDKMNCDNCGLESRYLKYTSFYHTVIASSLRRMKVMHPQKSFEEILHLVQLDGPYSCRPEAGGCGHLNYVHHFLSAPPHVYTIVLVRQTGNESVDDIKATLAVLSTEIDISVICRRFHPQSWYRLVSVVSITACTISV